MENNELLKKRFEELSRRAEDGGYSIFTDFLDMNEQQTLFTLKTKFRLFGGYEGAERAVACFPPPYSEPENGDYPISFIEVVSTAGRYTERLTHRDYLGALMSLGIKRETLGDILVCENAAYVTALDRMAEYIREGLKEIKRTPVKCTVLKELPEVSLPVPTPARTVVASDRADALLASVFNLSRSEARAFFASERVFINAKATVRPDEKLNGGDIVSVRGKGRVKIVSFSGETRKGRLWADILKY